MTPVVGVVGPSARAAVHSLARADLGAWAVDQFADRDLKRVVACAVCPHDRYPDAILELTARFPPGPVLNTGGLENYPHVLRELAARRELWGNPADVVERVRDPFALFPALAAADFAVPRFVPHGEPCPTEGRWLRKPLRSGGGFGIRFAQPGELASPHHYFQEFIAGVPMSAIYVNAALVGVTEQLIGESWLHANPFAYCGNIGSLTVPDATTNALTRLGRAVADRAGLRGTWGVDFISHNDGPHPIEVNPRYTAAVEVVEHAAGVAVFREVPSPPAPLPSGKGAGGDGTCLIGKAVYYAPHTIHFPPSGPWDDDLAGAFDPWRVPKFADIPEPASAIEPGAPVLTFFAAGSTPAEVRERLQSRAVELDRTFRDDRP
jgi:predicted ATP-grasp superfamily ATP-dependent carboligase